jgi:hypothetical protein
MSTDSIQPNPESNVRYIVQWFKSKFRWSLLLSVPLVALTIAALSSQDFLNWGTEYVLKAKLEIVHPALLFGFVIVSLGGWLVKGLHVSAWMALLGAAFFMREIHFEGSDYLMVIVLLGIFTYAWRNSNHFTKLWIAQWPLSMLVMCFISYASSEILFDRGLIKQPFEIIFNDPDWMLPHSSNIEESLETLGGLFILLSGILFVFPAAETD